MKINPTNNPKPVNDPKTINVITSGVMGSG